jgi:subfamily B ATP-binding cassette protein MsbA
MTGAITCSLAAAVLDTFSAALLIPFLNVLFAAGSIAPGAGPVSVTLNRALAALVDPSNRLASLGVVLLIVIASVVVKNLLVWFAGHFGATLQEHVTRDLRNAVYAHLARLPLPFFARTKVGQLMSRVITDTQQTKQIITQVITQSIQSSALVLTGIVLLVLLSPGLTLLALVIAPTFLIAMQPLLKRLRAGHRRLANDFGEMTSVVQETVSGIRLVKSYGAEQYEESRFRDASDRYATGMIRVTRISFLAQPLTEVIGMLIAVLILWVGAREVLNGGGPISGGISGSELIVFMIVVMRQLQPLKQLSQLPTTAQQSLAAAERLFDVLDAPAEPEADRGTRDVAGFRERLVFDAVHFAYDTEPVLTDVSFTASRGDVIAIVGPSGAGKSTLVDLIPRLYEPTQGRMLLDGVDTREIRLPSLRALIGIVAQDTVLFNDTVRNNIAYGAPGRFSDAQIEAAARAANAHGFIAALPKGYDTLLGERGTRLSGGQRQRLAIARALLCDPPILILDEATSALDTESERLVQTAIDRLLEGRTVFVIAHRLSTVMHASTILVLDQGRIVERGSHESLLARRGLYARLHDMQFRDRVEPAGV